ncbi:(d)CMP kinase [candidate division WOR-3 bacterium]|nr:(d)CMP kinase [candidate division WOR-3 bacterium]
MIVVTIDGPSAAGKSTVAKIVARELAYMYLDTGAMYRAATLYFIENRIDIEDRISVVSALDSVEIEYGERGVILNGSNVESKIRNPEVTKTVSPISAIREVREKLVEIQRGVKHPMGLVCEGRDMGSVVFPGAQYKFFLTASLYERAKRRRKDLEKIGVQMKDEEVGIDLSLRDKYDSEREISPMVIPQGAHVIDTTDMTISQVVEKILLEIEK